MKDYRNFFKKNNNEVKSSNKYSFRTQRNEEGKIQVAIHSTIFSDIGENLLASNSMFSNLLEDIKPCVEPYSANENIVLQVYETKPSNELSRTTAIVGFKRYVNGCYNSLRKQHLYRLFLFGGFLLIGLLIEFLLYFVIKEDNPDLPRWIFKSIEVLASLFIWQFGGYIAFEFLGELKTMKRYKQIANIDFEFNIGIDIKL